MNEKIKKLYDLIHVAFQTMENKEFVLYLFIGEDALNTKVSCSKYAKFIINDFKALEKDYGNLIYNFDGLKLKALFSISEQYGWYNRKELIDFIKTEI